MLCSHKPLTDEYIEIGLSLIIFLLVILQVGEIQSEWLQELYKVSFGLWLCRLIICG